MSFWVEFWKWTLIVAVTIFVGVAIVVTVRGAFDIRAMFRSIRERHDEESGDSQSPS